MVRSRRILTLGIAALVVVSLAAAAPSVAATNDELTCDFPLEVTDATGETVVLEEEPTTIVTTAPSAAQTMWEIGAADKVIGLSMHGMFLDGATDRTNVSANPMEIDIEQVVELDPDLVIAPNVTPHAEVESLRQAGLTVYHAEVSTTIDDIVAKTETLGTVVGECEGTQATLDSMNDRLDAIDAVQAGVDDPPLVFYATGGGFTAGDGTFQQDALERAGLTNLAGEVGIVGWGPISGEVLVDENPEWIVYPDSMTEDMIIEAAQETTAWDEDQLVAVDAQAFSQPAPMIVDAIESIHLAVYGDIDASTPTPDPSPTPSDPSPSPTPTPSDTATPIPGFSLVVGALGILGLALLARRR